MPSLICPRESVAGLFLSEQHPPCPASYCTGYEKTEIVDGDVHGLAYN